ncbi:MAG: RNB domain-containing ribonuclease [Cyanobacteria bacterium RI_101]|nr:RNB domain-containing ribonuclease [Cyanobacteria bacterium RI_101]
MEKGELIEFRLQGERRLAVVDRPDGKKDWYVVDQGGQNHKIRPQRAEYTVPGGPYQAADIAPFLAEVEPYLDPGSLEVAWELLVEDNQSVNPAQLAQLLFSEQSPAQCYAAHLLLSEDRAFFKQKGDVYEPRSLAQVEEIRRQQAVEAQREQERLGFCERFQRALGGEKTEWTNTDRQRLESWERFVLFPEQSHRPAQDLLQSLGQAATPEATLRLLVTLGWWSAHENLFLRRSAYPRQFSSQVADVTQALLQAPPPDPDSNRLDLTHLKVYTIDDESTAEIDDGLSAETLPSGEIRYWIHIADPSRLVFPNDVLDLEARKRSTTLYLPTGMISMFPTELATGPMSLVQGQDCPALSFGVVLTESGAAADVQIAASRIRPTYRLSYDDVEEMLQLGIAGEPELKQLAEAAKRRERWRREQGAIFIQMPEAVIKVNAQEEISIQILESSTARQLVAEMMILAGEVAGRYCQEHQLPVPFRGQPQPDLPPEEELLLIPAGPPRSCAVRRCMPRSEVSVTPSRHASLGLDLYTQVTSPIRRYTDLLAHFQIKAHLRGENLPFSQDEMQNILYSVLLSSQEANAVERQTNRYWSLEYLRRQADQTWQGLMLRWLREDEGLGLILLEELGLELAHRFERPIAPGDRLVVQVSQADPRRDEIRFRELAAAAT